MCKTFILITQEAEKLDKICSYFLDFLSDQNKSFAPFSLALCMQSTQLALTQFPDELQAKLRHKHQGVVKIKAKLYMEVFEVDDLPLWIVIVLCGW